MMNFKNLNFADLGKLAKGKKNKKRREFWTKTLFGIFLFLIVIVPLAGVGVYAYFAKDLPSVVDLQNRKLIESTKIFDRTGEVLLYEVHGKENRTIVQSGDIPKVVRDAFIAAEDRNFYQHNGVNLSSIVRSLIKNIESGDRSQGGSTITQQFVKNALLSNQKTYIRKLQEAILSVQIERQYSKDDIMTFYLNEIPFGSNIYGIEKAAEVFFGKSANQLEAGEAAMLASLIKAPSYYSPYGSHTDALRDRQLWILEEMFNSGAIDRATYENAKSKPLDIKPYSQDIKAPHFVFYIKEKLAEEFGEDVLEQGGMNVITTLDYDLQLKAEQILKEKLPALERSYDAENGAIGAVDPKTGQILVMAGSRDYFDVKRDGNVNILTSLQSPGSSIKPIVYTSAFKKGYNPNTILFDLKTNFGTDSNPYEPNNFNMSFRGPVSMRQALANSLNIPAVKTLYLAGIKDTSKLAQEMGITDYNNPDNYGLAMALGGVDLKIIEEIGAYSVLANDGKKNPLETIVEIKDNSGKSLKKFEKREKRILEPQVARLMNNVMKDNEARSATFGFTNNLTISGIDIGAKTGTSQEFRDALTLGYTTEIVAGVWIGKNDNSPMKNGADGSVVAAPIWNAFMRETLANYKPGKFTDPEPITVGKTMLNGKYENVKKISVNSLTGKLANSTTPTELIVEKEFKSVHSILYYVNKDNPLGDYPKRPQDDPQFSKWEGPVKEWAQKEGFATIENIPEEDDDVYTEGNRPSLNFVEPKTGVEIKTKSFLAKVNATAPNGISRVEFFVDGSKVDTVESSPYQTQISTPEKGTYVLKARAYDSNRHSSEIDLNFSTNPPAEDNSAPVVQDFQVLGSGSSYSLKAQVTDDFELSKVEFYDAQKGQKLTEIDAKTVKNGVFTYNFIDTEGRGAYKFYVMAYDQKGNSTKSQEIAKP
jgi:1A family penicillin-binding protein